MTARLLSCLGLLFVVWFMAAAPLSAQGDGTSLNMTLFDHVNPVRTDSVGPSSSLWGYVAPDGREYALVGTQVGTFIIDVTEKPLRQVALIPGPQSIWREMKVYKHYAYIVTESAGPGHGLQIVDLSGLPATVTLARTDSTIFQRAHTIFIDGHRLFVNGTQADAGANGGAIIYDLEPDPLHPQRIGMVNPYYYHDSFERNDTLLGAAINGQGCDIYDIKDLSQPKHLATITYPFSGTHNAEITSDGGYVVTSDEIGSTPKTMKVWDIHDMNNIRKVAEFTPNLNDIVHNVHVRGRYVIAAWYTAGVRIIDMIDPLHPREVGYYDTYPGNSGDYNGAWEAYGFFPSGKVIVGDRQSGLYVLEFNKATAGSVSGVVRNRATGDPMPGVVVRIAETFNSVTTDAQGRYYIGGPNGTTRTLNTSSFGFGGYTRSFTLAGDTTNDILLDPLPFAVGSVTAQDAQGAPISDFAYAVEPFVHSAYSSGDTGALLLPRDSGYTVVVGKWGYHTARVPVRLTANNQNVVATLAKGYFDDATLDLGWSYGAFDDNATTGLWTRIVPNRPFAGSQWIFPPVQPDGDTLGYVFQTGAPVIDAPPQAGDVNGGRTTLISPTMDLHGFVNPTFDFDLWFVHYKKDTVRDSLRVQISNDDGASWHTLDAEAEGRGGWKAKSLPVNNLVTATDRMRFRVSVSDTLSNAYMFAGLDNFVVNDGLPFSVPDANPVMALQGLTVAPNPIGAAAGVVRLYLDRARSFLRLELYAMNGTRVAVLHDGPIEAGDHGFSIGAGLASGAYVLRAIDGAGAQASCSVIVQR